MAKILHIQTSERGGESFSIRLAQAFLRSYIDSHPGHSVKTLRLGKDTIPHFGALAISAKYHILYGQSPTEEESLVWQSIETTILDFKSAQKLVISSPMWNFGIPYHLKQYFDVLVQPGYTFSYSPKEGYKGLVTDRPAMLLLARAGVYAPGTERAALDFQRPYLESILQFIGFTKIDCIVVEPTLQGGPEVAREKLAEAVSLASAKAKNF
jgi:FMN-dependent NADH-azoreductase